MAAHHRRRLVRGRTAVSLAATALAAMGLVACSSSSLGPSSAVGYLIQRIESGRRVLR